MINIHYFANIRETLETESESLALPVEGMTVNALIDHLIELHGKQWSKVLKESSVMVAVNQTVAKLSATLKDGDEVAFFPPVTGG